MKVVATVPCWIDVELEVDDKFHALMDEEPWEESLFLELPKVASKQINEEMLKQRGTITYSNEVYAITMPDGAMLEY